MQKSPGRSPKKGLYSGTKALPLPFDMRGDIQSIIGSVEDSASIEGFNE